MESDGIPLMETIGGNVQLCEVNLTLVGRQPWLKENMETYLNHCLIGQTTGLDAQHIIVKGFPSSADLLICLSPILS